MKKLISLVLAAVMVMSMTLAFAESYGASNAHVITITNNDQNVSHNYEAYQVFAGNLDSKEMTLSDIKWGAGVKDPDLLNALKGTTDAALLTTEAGTDALGKTIAANTSIFANCETAQDVAKVLATLQSTGQKYDPETGKATSDDGTTDNAGAIDAVATIIAANLNTKAANFTENPAKTYKANVTGDGYYFIKDVTTTLTDDDTTASDTKSKYLLSVVKDVTIVAKDTGITPDKEILQNGKTTVKAGSAAIGDTVNFQVTVEVPNTKKYEEKFWFVMNDTLPKGITFTGITSVDIDGTALTDVAKASPTPDLTDANYNGSAGYYTLAVTNADDSANNYAWETTGYDAVKEAGGQAIVLTFNQFKKFVETKDLIGKTVTVKYTGVVNDDAEYEATENENQVTFKYSNDPNHDYDGDTPNDDSVTGTTPKSTTRTYTTSLKILKVGDDGKTPLAGAEFTLAGTNLNRTVITGTKFVPSNYDLPENGEAFEKNGDNNVKYWLLKDGSYTATDPTTVQNTTQYQSTSDVYYKVIYDFVEISPSETKTPLVITTDANGVAEFVGLNAGTYTLEETNAPEGYNKIDGTATIVVSWSDPEAMAAGTAGKDQGGFTIATSGDGDFYDDIAWNGTDKQFEVTIMNQKGSVLPSTGGIGTTLFYVIGACLVLGAGVLLVTKRKMVVNK